ncbi:MAG: hypothetical protein AAF446_08260, partial [Pseudomonadota bacterium]
MDWLAPWWPQADRAQTLRGWILLLGALLMILSSAIAHAQPTTIPITLNEGDLFVNAPVGVQKNAIEVRTFGFVSPALAVVRTPSPEPEPPILITSPAAGIHFGPGIVGLTPNRLSIAQTAQSIRVDGVELNVSETLIVPSDGITVTSITPNGDGTQVMLTVDVGVDAVPGLRRLVLIDNDGNVIPELVEKASLVLIEAEGPQIDSITPNRVAQGDVFDLVIRGRNLRGLPFVAERSLDDPNPEVLVTPASGVIVGSRVTVNDEGTLITVPIQILPGASAEPRLVQVSTRSGISSDLSSPANTLNISDQSLRVLDRLTSPLLGVQRGMPELDETFLISSIARVLKGPGVISIDPQTVMLDQTLTLRIQGNELASTSQVQILPADGIDVIDASLSVSDAVVEIDIQIAGDAPLFEREVRLITDNAQL